jgi:hypothetical protein
MSAFTVKRLYGRRIVYKRDNYLSVIRNALMSDDNYVSVKYTGFDHA